MSGLKYYLVGGAVRDMQMGIIPKDYDFVVVGASPENFKGWECVGKDFPVYLEPTHRWELALARIERKVGVGYKGFEADWRGVTLKQDLYRRDLTINSLAIEVNFEESIALGQPVCVGEIMDYFGGVRDIQEKKLHPVSKHFQEDPLRCLRAASFLARYPQFTRSADLWVQCSLSSRELKHISRERIWQETEKALNSKDPIKYFEFVKSFSKDPALFNELFSLEKCDITNDYHKEDNAYIHTLMVMEYANKVFNDPEITFAGLCHDFGKHLCWRERGNLHGHEEAGVPLVEDFCNKYKVPNNYRDLALITTKQHLKVHNVFGRGGNKMTRPKSIMKMFEETCALSKPNRFKKMLKACEADARGRIGIAADEEYVQRQYLEECLEAVLSFSTKDLSQQLLYEGKTGIVIGQKIREERIRQIRQIQNKWKGNLYENNKS